MSSSAATDDWIALVQQRIEQLGSLQKVADELGYARPSLSLAIRGKYVGNTDKISQAVIKKYANVNCPYLKRQLTYDECQSYRDAEAPIQNPASMRHWRVCQNCEIGCTKQKRRTKIG